MKPENQIGKWRRRGLCLVLGGGLSFIAVSACSAHWLTAAQNLPVAQIPTDFPFPHEVVKFRSEDGVNLCGWIIPCPDSLKVAILCHGRNRQRGDMLGRAELFRKAGYNVFVYDARGCGESDACTTSAGYHETNDLLAAIQLMQQRGYSEIGCLGVSQGGATILLASDRLPPLRWVVLESVYPTLLDAIDRRFRLTCGVPGWLGGFLVVPFAEWKIGAKAEMIRPIDHLADLKCPVLMLHGENDQDTTLTAAEAMFEQAREPKHFWRVPDAAHEDLLSAQPQAYRQHLQEFLAVAEKANH